MVNMYLYAPLIGKNTRIDRSSRAITFPAAITKNRNQHTIPYGDLVEAVLDELPKLEDRYVFSGRTKDAVRFNGWSKKNGLMRLKKAN